MTAKSSATRVTIGIPCNHPERLKRAIGSALDSTVPVAIMIADDSDDDQVERIAHEYRDHPFVQYVRSPAKTLWENWRFVAQQARTDFFLWLQDDDVVVRDYARDVINGLDLYPKSVAYIGCIRTSQDVMLSCWWQGGMGPYMPLDYVNDIPREIDGLILSACAYFLSWSISPAIAFRNTKMFQDVIEELPDGCDLFTERLHLARLGLHGTMCCHHKTSALYMFHGRNEAQLTRKNHPAQRAVAIKYLEKFVPNTDWEPAFRIWLGMVDGIVLGQGKQELDVAAVVSPTANRLRNLVNDHMDLLQCRFAELTKMQNQLACDG
jgi:Glycosyl transferase family 2